MLSYVFDFFYLVLLGFSQRRGVPECCNHLKTVEEFYIYADVHFVSLQNIVMYKCNTKVSRRASSKKQCSTPKVLERLASSMVTFGSLPDVVSRLN